MVIFISTIIKEFLWFDIKVCKVPKRKIEWSISSTIIELKEKKYLNK